MNFLFSVILVVLGAWILSLSMRLDVYVSEFLRLANKANDIDNDQFDLQDQLDELKKKLEETK